MIIFRVVERPTIQHFRIYGSTRNEKTLKKKAGLKPGDALDPYAVEEGRTKVEEYLHSKAYAQATVTILEGNKPGDRGVRFMVSEGLKQKIWATNFEGNKVAPDGRFKSVVQSKPGILWLFKGEVDYDRINEDVRRLTEYYRSLGFFRARVGREYQFSEKQNWMTLTFYVDEGPRFVVGDVSVIGNTKIGGEQLTKDLKLKGGEFFDQSKMNKDLDLMRDRYGQVGYIFADIQSEPRFLEQPGTLDLVYKIAEGDRYRIGRIDVKISGDNPHTRRTAVLNRLSLRTGDIANTKKIRDSEQRLKRSSMFANNPAQGQAPKIVFAKPGMEQEEEEDDTPTVARGSRRRGRGGPGVSAPMGLGGMGANGMGGMGGGGMNGMGFNGQSPDLEPAEPGDGGELGDDESVEVELVPENPSHPDARGHMTTVARPLFERGQPTPLVVRAQSPGWVGTTSAPPPAVVAPTSSNLFGQQPLRRTGPDALVGGSRVAPPGTVVPAQYSQPGAVPVYAQQPGTAPPVGSYGPPAGAANGYSQAGQGVPNGYAAQPPVYTQPGGYVPSAGYPAPGAYPGSPGPPPVYGQQGPPPSALPPPAQYGTPPSVPPLLNGAPGAAAASPGGYATPQDLGLAGSPYFPPEEPARDIPVIVRGQETQTGRLMLGVGVNSNAGLIGNITLDEQNFDWRRWPTSWEDIRNATAWRGGGQQFRIQASPGTVYQQYMVNFNNPYLFNTPISFGLSGSYFTRIYNNWTEKRLGARVSLGYQFLFDPNLTTVVSFRGENVNISNPSVPTPPELAAVLGNNALFAGQWQFIHDTRDSAFLATSGHRIAIGLEEAFGSFVFPRATIDASQHFLLHERPDTSGRQTLTVSNSTGFTGANTPIYENFFAGGYTTLRGFFFRGASPLDEGVQVGGHFSFINTVEYMFPLTGDDMLRAVAFTDFGTVEPNVEMTWQDFRISPGLGLRVTLPAMGPAPIALDFAVPVHHAPGDQLQLFSFFIGVNR